MVDHRTVISISDYITLRPYNIYVCPKCGEPEPHPDSPNHYFEEFKWVCKCPTTRYISIRTRKSNGQMSKHIRLATYKVRA